MTGLARSLLLGAGCMALATSAMADEAQVRAYAEACLGKAPAFDAGPMEAAGFVVYDITSEEPPSVFPSYVLEPFNEGEACLAFLEGDHEPMIAFLESWVAENFPLEHVFEDAMPFGPSPFVLRATEGERPFYSWVEEAIEAPTGQRVVVLQTQRD